MNFYYIKKYKDSPINSIQINIASPKSIFNWSSRRKINDITIGEIETAQTMNYKTLKPENLGLFCEQIFGPINDFECACGKRYENESLDICSQCKIEYISSRVRRNRLAYIKLISPVAHIWYIKYISILLDISFKHLDSIIYCTDDIVFKNQLKDLLFSKNITKKIFITDSLKNTKFLKHNLYRQNYVLRIQKDLITYLRTRKKAIFLSSDPKIKKKKRDSLIEPSYYMLNTFSLLSYSFQWEAKKQWNTIIWYLKYSQKFSETSYQIDPKARKSSSLFFQEFEIRNLFGTRIIYSWLKYFDYNFQLLNLERQIRFFIFELREEIKEISSILLISSLNSRFFQSFHKRIKQLDWKKNKAYRRLKLVVYFRRAKIQPRWMILSLLPVLPPDLRPIVELGSNKVAVSDINKSYQTVLLRNIRLKKFYNSTNFNDFIEEIRYTKRLLQESVDDLIQQKKSKKSSSTNSKSISDVLKGKRGRFRQNLLGKRVDYSGRSVIIVDPTLQLHECGIPLKMAIELFYPFIIQEMVLTKFARSIPGAKKIIAKNKKVIISIIIKVLQNYLVLLNRAPTLHKLGIQAFQPKLVAGKAIRLHPLVCPAFNADFDGDQMGLHIPLSFEARAEAWKLLWSRNNILFPATSDPVLTPGQDMILGCYYLTSSLLFDEKLNYLKPTSFQLKSLTIYFNSMDDVLKAYYQQKIDIHTNIWIRLNKITLFEFQNNSFDSFQIYKNGNICFNYSNQKIFYNFQGYYLNQYIRTTVGRVILNQTLYTSLT
uniref:DNA-directed RNA polymerase subunit n=1 Tax=Gymnochlora stellata TaxID=67809 RepID=A0A140JZJ6_GYMST|nr:RNA polymerase gamma subunit [Gymnochlora stellata]BAU62523.1 RNA polymerase gamma subunit [Gymnochlora stellata]